MSKGREPPYSPPLPHSLPLPSQYSCPHMNFSVLELHLNTVLQHVHFCVLSSFLNIMSLTPIHVATGGINLLFFPCYVVFCCSKIPSVYLALLHFIWIVLALTHKKAALSIFVHAPLWTSLISFLMWDFLKNILIKIICF